MKKIILFIGICVLKINAQVWVNEISYDMTGTDSDDFVEIVAPIGTDMSTYGVLLVNGNNDMSYGYVQLTGTISSTNANNGYGFFILLSNQSSSITVPLGITSQTEVTNGFGSGIQNGAPDGIILLNALTGATIHGMWYEESGTPPTEITRDPTGSPPGSGPYSMTGVNIASIGEDGSSAIGGSISINGDGNTGLWEITLAGSPGSMNTNQTSLPVELSSFTAKVLQSGEVKLDWRTETEVNNYGFEVQKSEDKSQELEWNSIGFVEGNGNSNSPKEYTFMDEVIKYGSYAYRLKQIDTDGQFEYSKIIKVDAGNIPNEYVLEQNYPNPFNPTTTIQFTIPKSGNVTLKVFNILGEQVAELINEFKESGIHKINFDATDFNSGVYIYQLEMNNSILTRKMAIIK